MGVLLDWSLIPYAISGLSLVISILAYRGTVIVQREARHRALVQLRSENLQSIDTIVDTLNSHLEEMDTRKESFRFADECDGREKIVSLLDEATEKRKEDLQNVTDERESLKRMDPQIQNTSKTLFHLQTLTDHLNLMKRKIEEEDRLVFRLINGIQDEVEKDKNHKALSAAIDAIQSPQNNQHV